MSQIGMNEADRMANAIESRIKTIAQQVYKEVPNDKEVEGLVISKNSQNQYTIKINNATYTNIMQERSLGEIKPNTIVKVKVPNNQMNNAYICGVVDGTISVYSEGGGAGTAVNVIDNLDSTSTTEALSANQGRILNNKINENKILINENTADIEQLNSATINGKLISNNPVLTAADVGALPSTTVIPEGIKLYNELGQNTDGAMTQKAVTDELNKKVDKVEGKSLIADSEIARLANVTNYDDTALSNRVGQNEEDIVDLQNNKADKETLENYVTNTELENKNYATETYVQEKGGKIDKIKVNGVEQTITNREVDIQVDIVYKGTSNTESSVAEKNVVCENFVLEQGAIIDIEFTYGSYYTTTELQLSLNVNNTGAKRIVYKSSGAISNLTTINSDYDAGRWADGNTMRFIYTGEYWTPLFNFTRNIHTIYWTERSSYADSAEYVQNVRASWDSTKTSLYPILIDSYNSSSSRKLYTDNGISYNSTTNVLTTTGGISTTNITVSGNLTDGTNSITVANIANANDIPKTAADIGALPNTTKYAAKLSLSINNSTYVITAQLKDQDGNNLGTAQTIDLPLESVVVSGSYDKTTKEVILTLKDGSTIKFSVADLVSGLATQVDLDNLEVRVENLETRVSSIDTKISDIETKNTQQDTLIENKVDKVDGKGLSTNDYTTDEKNKLAGIASGAEVNVQSDWNATSGDAYIKNKPTLATVATSGSYNDLKNKPVIPSAITVDSSLSSSSSNPVQNKVITDDLYDNYFNNIQKYDRSVSFCSRRNGILGSIGIATTDSLGFMSSADKTKLDGIEAGAEVNVQTDWNETDTTSPAYLKNKPDIPEGSVLYTDIGQNIDGSITQKKITELIQNKLLGVADGLADGEAINVVLPNFVLTECAEIYVKFPNGVDFSNSYSHYMNVNGTGKIQIRVKNKRIDRSPYSSNDNIDQNGICRFVYSAVNSSGYAMWILKENVKSGLSYNTAESFQGSIYIARGGGAGSIYKGEDELALSDHYVDKYDAQTIAGVKNFTSTPTVNGVNVATVDDIPSDITVDNALSSTSENPVQNKVISNALDGKLSTSGGTINASSTITMGGTSNATGAKLKWGTVNSNTPYTGFASDQTDGTFVISSLKGTNYASGLAIGGGSGNLLWKGTKVATTSDIPTNYVTTNTEQTIPGAKTFTQNVVKSQSTGSDGFSIRNTGYTAGDIVSTSVDLGKFSIYANDTLVGSLSTNVEPLIDAEGNISEDASLVVTRLESKQFNTSVNGTSQPAALSLISSGVAGWIKATGLNFSPESTDAYTHLGKSDARWGRLYLGNMLNMDSRSSTAEAQITLKVNGVYKGKISGPTGDDSILRYTADTHRFSPYASGVSGSDLIIDTVNRSICHDVTNYSSATAYDLGNSNTSFKDLYLSGGIYHSSNKLTLPSTAGTLALTSQIPTDYATKQEGVYFVDGTGNTTAGTWTGTNNRISSYYDGLTVIFKIGIAGASTTTLNINGLGAKTCYLRGTTKVTTHYAVGTMVIFTYNATTDAFYSSDYDANTNVTQTVRTTNGNFPLLLRGTSAGTTTTTTTTTFGTKMTANPSTGNLTATTFTEGTLALTRKYGTLMPYGTQITSSESSPTDLNTITYLKVGNYYCSQNTQAKTLVNCPTTVAFMMQVLSPLSTTIDNETTSAYIYRVRKLMTYTGEQYIQYVSSGATAGSFTYRAWEKITDSSDIDTALSSTSTNAVQNKVINSALASKLNTSGGTITGTSGDTPLYIQSASTSTYIGFRNSSGTILGYLGVNNNKRPVFYDSTARELALKSDIPADLGGSKITFRRW